MSFATLVVAALLTQTPLEPPEGFTRRPEVRAFVGGKRVESELFVSVGEAWLVVMQTRGELAYLVVDARGRLNTSATLAVEKCLSLSPRRTHNYPTRLLGDGSLVIGNSCLVDPGDLEAVRDVSVYWGKGWELMQVAVAAEAPAAAVLDSVRNLDDYVKRAQEPTVGATRVEVAQSAFDVVLVTTSARADQKLFVIERRTGKTRLDLSQALERQRRDELVSLCGESPVELAPTPEGAHLVTEWGGEDRGGCLALIRYDPRLGLLIEARDLAAASAARQAELLERGGLEAERLWREGRHDQALERWDGLMASLTDDGLGDRVCRTSAEALADRGRTDEATERFTRCTELGAATGETFLAYARFLRGVNDPTRAIACYLRAAAFPIAEADRREAERALVVLRCEVAEAAARRGDSTSAQLHLRHVQPVDPVLAQRVARLKRKLR
ncbi:MAG: hypothetical protein IPJ65_35695 [Archangiaceae bacterium]|nr:hypothetical protein [Archangiaceae bacterium]